MTVSEQKQMYISAVISVSKQYYETIEYLWGL